MSFLFELATDRKAFFFLVQKLPKTKFLKLLILSFLQVFIFNTIVVTDPQIPPIKNFRKNEKLQKVYRKSKIQIFVSTTAFYLHTLTTQNLPLKVIVFRIRWQIEGVWKCRLGIGKI